MTAASQPFYVIRVVSVINVSAVSTSRNSVLAKPSLPVRESFHVEAVYF